VKQCMECLNSYDSSIKRCPNCGYEPVLIDGFYAYAPELARTAPGFKPAYFLELASLEEDSFWFQARRRLILFALKRFIPAFDSFMEIGCGTGYILSEVYKAFPHTIPKGSEIYIEGLSFAKTRLPTADLLQMDARRIPFKEEVDVIGAFDVLEHIHEDELVLRQTHQALKSGGLLLITVPQHRWLWSRVDENACHVRRYSKGELHEKLANAGFRVLRSTSFISLLLPAMWLSRTLNKLKKNNPGSGGSELSAISPILNSIFKKILSVESFLIFKGVDFSMGGSRFVVAKKIDL